MPPAIQPRWLDGVATVGVSSGASVPQDLVEGVIAYLRGLGPVVAWRVAVETIHSAYPNRYVPATTPVLPPDQTDVAAVEAGRSVHSLSRNETHMYRTPRPSSDAGTIARALAALPSDDGDGDSWAAAVSALTATGDRVATKGAHPQRNHSRPNLSFRPLAYPGGTTTSRWHSPPTSSAGRHDRPATAADQGWALPSHWLETRGRNDFAR